MYQIRHLTCFQLSYWLNCYTVHSPKTPEFQSFKQNIKYKNNKKINQKKLIEQCMSVANTCEIAWGLGTGLSPIQT